MLDSLRASYAKLPPNLQGVVWMLLAATLWLINLSLVKFLSDDFSPAMLSFLRTALSALFIVPIVLSRGRKLLRLNQKWRMVFRACFGACGSVCSYYAVAHLPLSQFNAIVFSKPLFVMIMAFFFLGERFGSRRMIAAGVGFIGVLIMVVPGMSTATAASTAIFAAVTSAFFFAGYNILAKLLTRDNAVITVLIYSNMMVSALLLAAILWLPYEIVEWSTPSRETLPLLLVMAFCGVLGQGFYIKALSVGEASFVSNVDFIRLPMTVGADILIFLVLPPAYIWPGVMLIIGSLIYISWREATLGRQQKPSGSSDGERR